MGKNYGWTTFQIRRVVVKMDWSCTLSAVFVGQVEQVINDFCEGATSTIFACGPKVAALSFHDVDQLWMS